MRQQVVERPVAGVPFQRTPVWALPARRADHVAELADQAASIRALLESGTPADLETAVRRLGRLEQSLRVHAAALGTSL